VQVGVGVTVGDGKRVGVADGVRLTVTVVLGMTVAVPVRPIATCVAGTTTKLRVGVAVGEEGPMRSERIIKATPTPKAKRATTAVTVTQSHVERGLRPSSSGTMSKSSSSDKKFYAFWRLGFDGNEPEH
jgi:hypothetical protein